MKFNSASDVHSWLEQLPRFQNSGRDAARFDLDRFRRYCAAAGDPQVDFPSIHIAGTNGKGSTASVVASIYRQAAYRVGLYTSPHLHRYHERFRIDEEEMGDRDLLHFFQKHFPLIERYRLTYFEIATAVAFWWFGHRKVDLAVLEAGLGGRLDATNVVNPVLSVITSVALDHTDILGSTLPQIAREKAGIIKPGVPVLIGRIGAGAEKVIREVAASAGSPFFSVAGHQPELQNGVFRLMEGRKEFRAHTGTLAPVQAYNLAMGWKSAGILHHRFPVSEDQVRLGLELHAERYPTPGRFERLHPRIEWYFDGAHNPEAVQAMKAAVSVRRQVPDSILVLSLMKDKLRRPLMDQFSDFKKIYYHALSTERAASFSEVEPWLEGAELISLQEKAIPRLLKELETELVIFTGSFYFYATVRDWLKSVSIDR